MFPRGWAGAAEMAPHDGRTTHTKHLRSTCNAHKAACCVCRELLCGENVAGLRAPPQRCRTCRGRRRCRSRTSSQTHWRRAQQSRCGAGAAEKRGAQLRQRREQSASSQPLYIVMSTRWRCRRQFVRKMWCKRAESQLEEGPFPACAAEAKHSVPLPPPPVLNLAYSSTSKAFCASSHAKHFQASGLRCAANSAAVTQVQWKPRGTRCGMRSRATGTELMLDASYTTSSLFPVAASVTNVIR